MASRAVQSGLARYARLMSDKLKGATSEKARERIQRAIDQGFTNIAYHSTPEPWDEIDLNFTDLGLHAGTPTQAANRALDKAVAAGLQRNRAGGQYLEETSVMPFAYRPGRALQMHDVGEFKDSFDTLLGLRSHKDLAGQGWIDDLLNYVEPVRQSYSNLTDWHTDTANLTSLAEIRDELKKLGYRQVVYPNQIENAYYNQTSIMQDAEDRAEAIRQQAVALREQAKARAGAAPDLGATAEDIQRYLNSDPLSFLSPEERALYDKYHDEIRSIRSDPANYDDPNSIIFLDPADVRSVNAEFAPAAKNEVGMFKKDGGPVKFGKGGIAETVQGLVDAAKRKGTTSQIDTPEFKNWFGKSEAVELVNKETGMPVTSSRESAITMPRVMYHTTRSDFPAFEVGRATKNSGPFGNWDVTRSAIFATPSAKDSEAYGMEAGKFAEGANTMPVYLRTENPLDLTGGLSEQVEQALLDAGIGSGYIRNRLGHWDMFDDEDGQELVNMLRKAGYDSVIFNDINPDTGDPFEAFAVFEPTQVKSAIGNIGTFDPSDPVITKKDGGPVYDPDRINQMVEQLMVPQMADGGPVRNLPQERREARRARATPPESLEGAFAQLEAAERAARLRGAGTPLERYTYETLGLEPGLDRAMILPFAGRGPDRELAMPGVVYEAAKALMTPGAVASGVPVSYEDVANLAGNVMGGGYAGSTPIDGAVAGMAIKQKGGNWLAGEIEKKVKPLRRRTISGMDAAEALAEMRRVYAPETTDPDLLRRQQPIMQALERDAASNDWIDKALSKYIRNEMATPEDPVRLQADAWAATQADLLAKKDAQIAKATADMEKARADRGFTPEMMTRSQAQIRELQKERDLLAAQTGLHMPSYEDSDWLLRMNENKRIRLGMPPTPMGVSPEARSWEALTDDAISPFPASEYKRHPANFVDDPWLKQVPDTAIVNRLAGGSTRAHLGFGHLIDEMRNALNPESGLPRELLINLKDLPKLTVPQMVERVSKINAWRAVQKAEADAAIAANAATFPYRTYETIPGTTTPNERGLRWVELRTPEDGSSDALKDALKYEGEMLQHCVGGYCPDVEAGQSRIFSLRDARGQPYTTIEVKPYPEHDRDFVFYELQDKLGRNPTQEEWDAALASKSPTIAQIKSTQNRAPAAEYLPFVQDFVRSGQWSDVGDLRNTGLYRVTQGQRLPGFSKEMEPGYYTLDELRRVAEQNEMPQEILDTWMNRLRNGPQYAQGGPVQGYANGGEVSEPKDLREIPDVTLGYLVRKYGPAAAADMLDELGELRGAFNAGLETQVRPDEGGLPGLALSAGDLLNLPPLLMQLAGVGAIYAAPYVPEDLLWIDNLKDKQIGLGASWINSGEQYAAAMPEPIRSMGARYDQHLNNMLAKYDLPDFESLDPMDRFALAAGEVAGQLPSPPNAVRTLARRLLKGAPKVISKGLPMALEYLTPTIDPKLANYAAGTVIGGGVRQFDGTDEPENKPLEYSPPPFPRMAEGGPVYDPARIEAMVDDLMTPKMAEGGPVKFNKGGINSTVTRLVEGAKERVVTAAERAAAGRRAAEMIREQEPIKASEALGRAREQGVTRVSATQADRTRVGGGNIGGPAFPALSRVDPSYEPYVWGVGEPQTATRLTNASEPGTAWTTMLGSAEQLKTNPIVFDKLKRGFQSGVKAGLLTDELAGKINTNLALTFGEGADIRDPLIWAMADTFEKRAALADVMMGKGKNPSEGGVALGGEKSGRGVIFRPSDILRRETEPGLLHPVHGGEVPTFAVGPRLFTLAQKYDVRPDLHPAFPVLISGRDLDLNFKPVPVEPFFIDWHKRFPEYLREKKKRIRTPGYYDYIMGMEGEGLPSQAITDAYLKHLMDEGFADGGSVNKPRK